jgi:His/Glu/Gln/Arg/opine family amino acid ABC transporter permease subunit
MQFDTGIILKNLPELMSGAWITLASFLIAIGIGVPLGGLICALRLREGAIASGFAQGYIVVLRVIPEAVLIFWMFYCLPPLTGYNLSGLMSGSLALGLIAAAYLAEIFRAGIQAIPRGQWEAAAALALPRRVVWSRIILPQAARLATPPFVNLLTEILKGTTLLATIGVADLALKAYSLGAQSFRYLEFLTAIAVIYFVIIFPIARFAEWVERRLAITTR